MLDGVADIEPDPGRLATATASRAQASAMAQVLWGRP